MSLFQFTLNHKVSDIFLNENKSARFKIKGKIVSNDSFKNILKKEHITQFLSQYIPSERIDNVIHTNKEYDFSFTEESTKLRIRGVLFHSYSGLSVVLRILPNYIPTVEELRIPNIIIESFQQQPGLCIVSGATGSGKSTTLASLTELINQSNEHHILTIEDPIEYLFEEKKSRITQREVGKDSTSFASALKNSLRQSPNTILIGELRDKESIQTAIELAETGHWVLTTLHSRSAHETISRLLMSLDANSREFIRIGLANSLRWVINQKLLPHKNGQDMTALFEVLIATSGVSSAIKSNNLDQIHSLMQMGAEHGMIQMEDAYNQAKKQNFIE